jgi:DNA transformation protein
MQFKSYLEDLLAPLAPVQIRKFFGGLGLSKDGLMFGMVMRDQLYFHTDEQTRPRFAEAGCQPFRYQTRVKNVTIESFYSVPDALFDEPDEFIAWARDALVAAAAKKRLKKRRSHVAEI